MGLSVLYSSTVPVKADAVGGAVGGGGERVGKRLGRAGELSRDELPVVGGLCAGVELHNSGIVALGANGDDLHYAAAGQRQHEQRGGKHYGGDEAKPFHSILSLLNLAVLCEKGIFRAPPVSARPGEPGMCPSAFGTPPPRKGRRHAGFSGCGSALGVHEGGEIVDVLSGDGDAGDELLLADAVEGGAVVVDVVVSLLNGHLGDEGALLQGGADHLAGLDEGGGIVGAVNAE